MRAKWRNNMPIISVIVPVYKTEQYLRRCTDSILGQTFRDFELILVDDGSPDGSSAICDWYAQQDARIVVIHQKNGGVSAARNAGLDWVFANSDSQWITFIDSDDWIHPQMLEQLLRINLDLGTKIGVCEHRRTDREISHCDDTDKAPVLYTVEEFFERYSWIAVYAWGKLYHRSCFDRIRFPAGKYYEDAYTVHRILFTQKKLAMIWLPYYYYYINPEGITQRAWSEQRLDYFEALRSRIAFFENLGCKKLVRNDVAFFVSLCFGSLFKSVC